MESNLLSVGNVGSRLAGLESLSLSAQNRVRVIMWPGPMFLSVIATFCGIKIGWIITGAGAVTLKTTHFKQVFDSSFNPHLTVFGGGAK